MRETNLNRQRYLEEMGITPVWRLRTSPDSPIPSSLSAVSTIPVNPDIEIVPVVPVEENQPAAIIPVPISVPVITKENKPSLETWGELEDAISACTLCRLCSTRNKVVPGVGDKNAKWLFIGEGPGYHEDQQGEPFVGRSGKLLDNMLGALGLQRGENTYIANIVKCRAADVAGKDRPPAVEEASACIAYLERQIELIKPEVIVTLGKTAAVALLNVSSDTTLASLRGRVHYYASNETKIPVIVSYHPAYLLRTPTSKKQAWADLCLAMETIEESTQEAV